MCPMTQSKLKRALRPAMTTLSICAETQKKKIEVGKWPNRGWSFNSRKLLKLSSAKDKFN